MRSTNALHKVKCFLFGLAAAGVPLAVTASCDSGSLAIFGYDNDDDYFEVIVEDDCYFYDCYDDEFYYEGEVIIDEY
jgi:hypothetical protein